MTGAAAKALRPTDGRIIGRLLRQLATLWKAPALAGITVTLNPRLSRTLGRLVGRPWRIELGPRALVSEKRLREVVTHEGAHAVLAMKAGPSHPAPHGPEWRRLMALAGYPDARGAHWRCHRGTGQSPQQEAEAAADTQNPVGDRLRPLVPRLPVQPTGPSAGEGLAVRRLRRRRPRRKARDHPKDEEAERQPHDDTRPRAPSASPPRTASSSKTASRARSGTPSR